MSIGCLFISRVIRCGGVSQSCFGAGFDFFFQLLVSLVYGCSCAMALPECWRDLEEAVVLRQAMSAAKVVLNEKGDIRMKQKEVQQLLTDTDLNLEFFEYVFGQLEDQMDDTELDSYLEVWMVEVTMASQDAEKEIARICQTNGLQPADIEVVGGYVTSRLAVTKQKRKISEAAPDIGEEASVAQSDELSSWKRQWRSMSRMCIKPKGPDSSKLGKLCCYPHRKFPRALSRPRLVVSATIAYKRAMAKTRSRRHSQRTRASKTC